MALAERAEREQHEARLSKAVLIAAAPGWVRARLRVSARGRIIAALLAFTLVKQLILVAAYPPFQGHDEVGHYGYLWTMEHFHRLPTLADNLPVVLGQYDIYSLDWPAVYTANHPPGFLLATTLFPRDSFLALTAPAAVAFVPQLSFEGAIVNNDMLSIFFGTLLLY